MKSKKIIVAALVAVAAIALAGCSPRSSMATLSTDSDSETAEVFSLAKVLNLGTNYLTSLDYDNAILQYRYHPARPDEQGSLCGPVCRLCSTGKSR